MGETNKQRLLFLGESGIAACVTARNGCLFARDAFCGHAVPWQSHKELKLNYLRPLATELHFMQHG
jgi:hypothetical protein